MKLFNSLLIFGMSFNAQATQICSTTYTPELLYREGIKRNVHLILKDLEVQSMDGLIQDAGKISNPELEHFTTAGRQFGDRNITSESRIWFNLQLGNKRGKRAAVVEAEKEIGQAELELLKLRFKREIFLGILRYKQINRELGFINNLNEIVQKLTQRYRNVSYLTPEQQVEFGTLNISQKDLEIQLAGLENESLLIKRFFQKTIDEKCDVDISLKDTLGNNTWPDLEHFNYEPDQSINFKIDQLLIKRSKFVFERENAKKYPDLKIGPVWQLNKLASREYNIYGVGFILPLSFDTNRGLRTHAQMNLEREQRAQNYKKTQREKEFDFRMNSYQTLRTKLLAQQDLEQYSKMTADFNKLFRRGLLSTSTFLNYKRELLNLAVKVHAIEDDLATHLMELFRLNNKSTDGFVSKVLKL